MSKSTFSHPDKKLQKLSRYYINLYAPEQPNYKHNLIFLSSIPANYFCIENIFSFEDERYFNYPNKGWYEYDYERILELDLAKKEDLEEFRLIAANLARVIKNYPEKIKEFKNYLYFEEILEFTLIEGLYEYFNITVDELLLTCVKYHLIKPGDTGALSLSKSLIFKQWYESLSRVEKIQFYIKKKYISLLLFCKTLY